MPRLLLFIPSEKAIINQQGGNLSLVEILDTVNVTVPSNFDVPPDAFAPLQWAITTVWLNLPEDLEKQYEQRTCVIHPDGQETSEVIMAIPDAPGKQRAIIALLNYPVGQEGEHAISLSLREIGHDDWREVAKYPVTVIYQKQNAPDS